MLFKKYSHASKYLRKEYKITGIILGLGRSNLKELHEAKQNLVKDHSEEELRTLKIDINSHLDANKQVNLVIVIITFLLSTILNIIPFYLQQSIKPVDWIYSAQQIINTQELENYITEKEKINFLQKQIESYTKEFNKGLLKIQKMHLSMLNIILLPLFMLFLMFLYRYRWLLSATNCVEEALEERKKLNNEKKLEEDKYKIKIEESRKNKKIRLPQSMNRK